MTRSNTVKTLVTGVAVMMVLALAAAQQGGGFGPPPGQGGQGGPPNQGPGQGGPGMQQRRGDSGMMLIRMKSVQKELNLTAEQIERVNSMPMGPGGPGGGPGGPGGGPGGPGGPPRQGGGRGGNGGGGEEDLFAQQGPPPGQGGPGQGGPGQGGPGQGGPGQGGPGQGMGNPLANILNKNQMERLHQLALQFDAPMTIVDQMSGRRLNLTEDQLQQIHEIIRAEMPPPPGGGPGGPGGGPGGPGGPPQGGQGGQGGQRQGGQGQGQGLGQRGPGGPQQGPMIPWAEMLAKKAKATKAVLAVLNDEQRGIWATMTGKVFTAWEEPKRPGQ